MISDLHHRRLIGIRGVLGGIAYNNQINTQHRIKLNTTLIKVSAGALPNNYLTFAEGNKENSDGYHLGYDEGWSTVATITRSHTIVISENFSGCLYSVYHTGNGDYKCFHTSRPAGADSDLYVKILRDYARGHRWTLIHEIPTAADGRSGVGINGCTQTTVATHVKYTVAPRPQVHTIRVRLNSQNRSVHQHRWITTTP
jgi:hypothetical protein